MKVKVSFWENSQIMLEFEIEGGDIKTVLLETKDFADKFLKAHREIYGDTRPPIQKFFDWVHGREE